MFFLVEVKCMQSVVHIQRSRAPPIRNGTPWYFVGLLIYIIKTQFQLAGCWSSFYGYYIAYPNEALDSSRWARPKLGSTITIYQWNRLLGENREWPCASLRCCSGGLRALPGQLGSDIHVYHSLHAFCMVSLPLKKTLLYEDGYWKLTGQVIFPN